jgi:hypothetical protein
MLYRWKSQIDLSLFISVSRKLSISVTGKVSDDRTVIHLEFEQKLTQ